MQRIKLTIEYDGRPFAGWQRQANCKTVQGAIEQAAAALDGQPVTVQGAGRTDAGVHASGQVAHLDLTTPRPIRKVADALNYHLRPEPIAILSAEEVSPDFNARFDAVKRAYLYRIVNRRADLALDRGFAWRVPQMLDIERMREASSFLVGEHDFTTFRDSDCQAKSPVRTLDHISLLRTEDRVDIHVSARSFLHRQVRSIVGSLVDVGRGVRPPEWISEILSAKDREACGPVAPAEGLCLIRVEY